uniref:Uncharacterized protein n=1 Tax=Acrobeloides nanus TaxID=290746 RepID=A0A914CN05_9BILA
MPKILENSMTSEENTSDALDPVNLWKKSNFVRDLSSKSEDERSRLAKTIGTRNTSEAWYNLQTMNPEDKHVFIMGIIDRWPYKWERRAYKWGFTLMPVANMLTAAHINGKICAKFFLESPNASHSTRKTYYSARQGLLAAPRLASITPIMGPIMFSVMQGAILNLTIWDSEKICQSCLFAKIFAIHMFAGIALPMIISPMFANYQYIKMNPGLPWPTNLQEILYSIWNGSKPAWAYARNYFLFQLIASVTTSAIVIQAREKIASTISMAPELVKEISNEKFDKKNSWWNKLQEFHEGNLKAPKVFGFDWNRPDSSFQKKHDKQREELLREIERGDD